MAMNKPKTTRDGMKYQVAHGKTKDLPAMLLKKGSRSTAKNKANTIEIPLYKKDSVMNWMTSAPRSEPMVFRIPTSFARAAALAVDRLIKLIMAIININAAIPPKI